MPYVKAEMHQIQFQRSPRSSSAPPDPLAGFKGPTSREGGEGKDLGRGREGTENKDTHYFQLKSCSEW